MTHKELLKAVHPAREETVVQQARVEQELFLQEGAAPPQHDRQKSPQGDPRPARVESPSRGAKTPTNKRTGRGVSEKSENSKSKSVCEGERERERVREHHKDERKHEAKPATEEAAGAGEFPSM